MNKTHHYHKPPRLATWMLRRLFPDSGRQSVQGDLTEAFQDLVMEKGLGNARFWFWGQVLRSIPHAGWDMCLSSMSMLRHYFKTSKRVIVRNKTYSLINLAGLAVGFTCCFLILSWVRYELGFDSFHKNAGELYRVVSEFHSPGGDINYTATSQAPLAEALKENYPEVVNAARSIRWEIPAGTFGKKFNERVWMVDPAFLDMFSFDSIQGEAKGEAFAHPGSIILTEGVAEKHFGKKDPVGKMFMMGKGTPFKIAAVIKDIPPNSHLDMDCLIPLEFTRKIGWDLDEWGGFNFKTYIQLNQDTDVQTFNHKIRDVLKTYMPRTSTTVRLQPLSHVHLYDLKRDGGLITYIYIFTFMAFFVLVIACINYMNLSTARSSIRGREIGVRQVMGAGRWQLIRQFTGEAFFFSAAAGILSVLLAHLFLPLFGKLTGRVFAISYSPASFAFLACIVIFAGGLSGLYPALYLSGVKPVHMLRNTSRSRGSSVWFRRALVVFQFAVSIFLFIATLVVYRQTELLKKSDLGYEDEGVICMNMSESIAMAYPALRRELLQIPAVKGITRTNTRLDAPQSSATSDVISWEGRQVNESMSMLYVMGMDTDFASTYGIKMKEGRFYSREFPAELRSGMVLNEAAVEAMNMRSPVGKKFHYWDLDGTIIGVVKNFHYNSLHHAVEPMVLKFGFSLNTISIRLKPEDIDRTLERVRSVFKKIVPTTAFEYEYLDDRLEKLYGNEKRMGNISRSIALLAVFISCLGLLGLAVFSTQQRTKEIGIRKVLGSSDSRIIWMLIREFSLWVLAANVFAWPLAYISSRAWLQNFAYKIPLGVWIFFVSGSAALVIALMTVGFLALKTAKLNPVDSLRHE
ncbi:MAG: ABC transporter permease [Candidatus Aminicenantes bacterium]|nr:ABC transporter permease [Candidatus Aminicenantes bacterium]